MVMPGQVFDSWVACLRSFSAVMRISAALLRSAADIMGGSLFDQWQAAASTTVSVGHSPADGGRPDHTTAGGQFSDERTSTGSPAVKPLPRQTLVAATRQSGAPFGASGQSARTSKTRATGMRAIVFTASLVASAALRTAFCVAFAASLAAS